MSTEAIYIHMDRGLKIAEWNVSLTVGKLAMDMIFLADSKA